MNQQTITAFHTFNSDLSNAVNTLHEALQQTNAFNSIAMYVDQFNDIIKFQEKAKAFTCFLQEQNEYHNLKYSQFKSKMNSNPNTKPASSQISIQSTPQSLNDWSFTANDRVSTSSTPEYQRWRGYDPQPSCSAYNDYLFNNAEIERIPFKVIDTDNDSDCTSEAQFVPSLPPSIKEEHKETHNYDVCDGAEDDEKWDLYPLIKTHAFTGFFAAAPTAPLEFKNDKVLKPPPSKWQEREEQNREIMNIMAMEREEQNQSDASAQPLYGSNEEAIAEYVESEEIANGVCADNNIAAAANGDKATAAADRNIRSIIGMKRRRSMHDMDDSADDSGGGLVSKNVSFIKGQQPPIRFIEYEAPKPSIYNNIEEHPHFHPLIHGEEDAEGKNEEETKLNDDNVNGEDMDNQITEVIDATSQHGKKSNCKLHQHARVDMRGYGNVNGNEAQEINKGIVTLKDALDKHFHVNHNDLKQMTKAIYSLRHHRYNNYNSNTNANANIKRKKRSGNNGEAKKKKS